MLHIIGTGHHYQLGAGVRFGEDHCTQADQDEFASLLRGVAAALRADVFAEELNQQALKEVRKNMSVVQMIAEEFNALHIFCEPDQSERAILEIRDDNQIRVSEFPKSLDERIVQRLVAESWIRREQEWLRRLHHVKSKQVLLVCGANHILTFVPEAKNQGFECNVIHEKWKV